MVAAFDYKSTWMNVSFKFYNQLKLYQFSLFPVPHFKLAYIVMSALNEKEKLSMDLAIL